MLWVGGHILLVNVHEVGWWDAPYELVHHWEEDVHHAVDVAVLGPTLAWLTNTLASAVVGLVVGLVVVAVMAVLPFGKKHDEPDRSGRDRVRRQAGRRTPMPCPSRRPGTRGSGSPGSR